MEQEDYSCSNYLSARRVIVLGVHGQLLKIPHQR